MKARFQLQPVVYLQPAVAILLMGMLIIAVSKADDIPADDVPATDLVVVNKSERRMLLLRHDKVVREYHIALGENPRGHKHREGDERTPEGSYILDKKKSDSAFYKAIRISYPNEKDRIEAEIAGVNPGGQIMIHGQRNGFGWLAGKTQQYDWTNGCIAITNAEMDEVWRLVEVGTPIEIRP